MIIIMRQCSKIHVGITKKTSLKLIYFVVDLIRLACPPLAGTSDLPEASGRSSYGIYTWWTQADLERR